MIPDLPRLLNVWRSLLFLAAIVAVLAGVGLKREQREIQPPEVEWLRLHGLLSDSDYAIMLGKLEAPAAGGDAQAQRLLGSALLIGPEPFRATQLARLCEARYWLRRAQTTSLEADDPSLEILNRMRLDCDGEAAGSRSSMTD